MCTKLEVYVSHTVQCCEYMYDLRAGLHVQILIYKYM